MQIRRAASLSFNFINGTTYGENFLTGTTFSCSGTAIDILSTLENWTDAHSFMEKSDFDPTDLSEVLGKLIRNEAIVVKGSPQANRDQIYRDTWRWGTVAGQYQFSLRDQTFSTSEEITERMKQYQAEGNTPPLLARNIGLETIQLPTFDERDDFFRTLFRRESRREYGKTPIELADLAKILFSGNGVKSVEDCGPFGKLPRTMTPSGGARNPYELYIYARKVNGLTPGFYHYSALDHDLGYIPIEKLPLPKDLLGGQEWPNEAAAIIFLAATFERTAWKYRSPLAYRVLLMESGYIAQNMLLAATHLGIAAAPTGALCESQIEHLIGLEPVKHAVIFAVVFGSTKPSVDVP